MDKWEKEMIENNKKVALEIDRIKQLEKILKYLRLTPEATG